MKYPLWRTNLSYTIAASPRQRSHSWVRVPQDSWPHFTVSDSKLPQPGGPGPCIYIPHEQGGPVILPGTGFPFLSLLRLAGLRWRYSAPPPHGNIYLLPSLDLRYIASGRMQQKTPFPSLSHLNYCLLIHYREKVFTETLPSNERLFWLHYSGFGSHVTILLHYELVPRGSGYVQSTESSDTWKAEIVSRTSDNGQSPKTL
jgi:hypothetical protein